MLNSFLLQALGQNLHCNQARLKNLCLLVSAVFLHRTVNLAVLATTPDGKPTSHESRYRRFQDFFQRFQLCLPSVGRIVLSRIPKPPEGYLLAMDRTNWQFGRRDINFLVIAIVVGAVSIPVVWKVLPKKTKRGNSERGRATRLLLVSNRFQGKKALDLYRRRWGIERLFGPLKKKGFDLEATHMTDAIKLEKLFAVVVLAFLFSYSWGCYLRASGRRSSRQSQRKSLFRLGLEDILKLLNSPFQTPQRSEELKEFLHWLKREEFNSIFLV